jgi:hypothetical protein
LVQPQFRPKRTAADLVDASPAGHLPQPEHQVRPRLDRTQIPVQFQKNLLRRFFRQASVVKKMVGQAEYHALVLPDDVGKGWDFTLLGQFGIFLETNCRASRDAHCFSRSQ